MKYLKELVLFEDAGKHEYGCSMIFFELPFMEAVHKIIDAADVYADDESERAYGLETDPHVTLLYGLHDDVDDDDVMDRSRPEEVDEITLCDVSVFDNPDYDVLKFDCRAEWLHECNKRLIELPHTNKYSDYHPHATIGYLKKGAGKKYVDMLSGIEIKVMPGKIVYSKSDGSKVENTLDSTEIK